MKLLKRKLSEQGSLRPKEMYLYIHSVLMANLELWALTNDVHFLDVIAALDQDRDLLSSWVHLNSKGNRVVAEAFAEKILDTRAPKPTLSEGGAKRGLTHRSFIAERLTVGQ